MQIKATMIPLHTSQNGHHKQSNKQQVLERMWRKGSPSALLVGLQTGATTMANSMEFPQKNENESAFDPAIPLLGLYPKNPETPIQKNLCSLMFKAAQFKIAMCWKQPKCPSVNEWIKKVWYIHTMEFCAVEKKKELLPFVTAWMELESIMLSKISQAVRDKYHMISPLTETLSSK